MSHEGTLALDLALRRLTQFQLDRANAASSASIQAAVAQLETLLTALIAEHATQRQFVHGTGPLYVAKTRNPSQYVDWAEILHKPAFLQQLAEGHHGEVGASTHGAIRIDAAQVISGVLSLARIPFAEHNEYSAKAVQATDPRLSTKVFTLITSEPVATGDFIAVDSRYPNGVCRRADPSRHQDGFAIGFVAEPYGEWEHAIVYPGGIVRVPLEEVSIEHLGATVFVDSETPGRIRMHPPPPPSWVQPVGQIVRIVTEGTAEIVVRYEHRIWNTVQV